MTIAGAALALFLGAVLQSATGFGFALVSAPVLFALIGPQEAVTAGVLVALVPNTLTLAGERRRPQVLVRDALGLMAWSLPGLALGALALSALSDRLLSVLVAVAVLAGVTLRALSRRSAGAAGPPRPWYLPAAGLSGGVLSTATSLNGPPLVFYLLARGASPAQMRDTLASIFLVLALLGIPALLLSGTFTVPEGLAVMVLAALAGQLLGRRAFGWLRGERYEPAVYAVLIATALVALVASVS
ncbi:MAG TPA: sulfite exporter TauE/SafE family protein [Solirubrobacteraceae bacterium]|nr:sulfite exporter TauE/SafE family protein [Solirubrobacteraceae bacterium]